ncbi:DUF6436 domain-containing protein [Pseudoalteromonas shioyasakiensis]|uniref:DUF6436 domain-containing protein n=1 Tax=Pseudoalteromonas shioyasakiensis TaxID=1190813 RepID=UPI0021187192|nr:DUF6436 domain-containing protein [Pseudoalteromonas shioyasakiensis]MCQ8878559.1 DUF6436 domain-containing protein [Pseudoalteromonas shioyasakiensis]
MSSLTTFDPHNELSQVNWLKNFKQQTNWATAQSPTLTIVVDDDCGCTMRSTSHIKQLQSQAINNGYTVEIINQHSDSTRLLPNVPGAVLLAENGDLVYAGPLSQGIACSASDGFVELAINNLSAGFNSQLIVSESRGCYCSDKR